MAGLLAAARMARALHAGQVRKGTSIPYITHPLGVARMVLEAGGSDAEVIAALLHDTVEDCGGMPVLGEIEKRFGTKVSRIVLGCTKTMPGGKAAYVARLARELPSVKLVAGADKLYNARAIVSDLKAHGPATLERFKGGKPAVLAYYHALVAALAGSPFGAHLGEAVKEMAELALEAP